jgi:hypothetical protein
MPIGDSLVNIKIHCSTDGTFHILDVEMSIKLPMFSQAVSIPLNPIHGLHHPYPSPWWKYDSYFNGMRL